MADEKHMPVNFTRDGRYFVVRFSEVDKGYSYQPTLEQFEQAGFVRASRLAAAEAMVEDVLQALRDLTARACNGCGEQVHKCACADDGAFGRAKRILASRPSEQANETAWEASGDAMALEAEQASKEDSADGFERSDVDGASVFLDEEGFLGNAQESELHDALCRLYRRVRLREDELVHELETQLAEAKAHAHRVVMETADLEAKLEAAEAELSEASAMVRADPPLSVIELAQLAEARRASYSEAQRMLRAAEAERAHLLEAAELVRQAMRDGHGSHDNWTKLQAWFKGDQSRATAAPENPQPQPHPQGARLGGPAEALRVRLVEAFQSARYEDFHGQALLDLDKLIRALGPSAGEVVK